MPVHIKDQSSFHVHLYGGPAEALERSCLLDCIMFPVTFPVLLFCSTLLPIWFFIFNFFSPEEQKQFVFLIWLFLKNVCFWANSEATQGAELNLKGGKVHLYRLWDGEGRTTCPIIIPAPQKVVKERVGKRSLSRCGNQWLRKGPHRNVHVSVWDALP